MKKILIIILTSIVIFNICHINYRYCQEYIPGEDGIKGSVNVEYFVAISEDFAIGANQYGYAVFKNPRKAMRRLKAEYPEGIKLIRKEGHLLPLNMWTFRLYKSYGHLIEGGTAESRKEAAFVMMFLDIYENSYSV